MAGGFSEVLTAFLQQSRGQDLKTSDYYPESFEDLNVQVSFGKGRKARVSWISFLAPGVATSSGYYPVFLYYQSLSKLVLSLGISETEKWSQTWPESVTSGLRTVGQALGVTSGFRYLDSWELVTYDVDSEVEPARLSIDGTEVSKAQVEEDLARSIEIYRSCLPSAESGGPKLVKRRTAKPQEEIEFRPSPEVLDLKVSKGLSNTLPLLSAIQPYSRLSIKDYQRSFQWTSAQIEELIDDLKEAVESREPHFFGTLIIQEDENGGFGTVVDGQQRLTTTFVLVSALRDIVVELGISEIPGEDSELMDTNVIQEVNKFLFSSNKATDQRFESNRSVRRLLRDNVIQPPTLNKQPRQPIPSAPDSSSEAFVKAVKFVRKELDSDLKFYATAEDKLTRIYLFYRAISQQFRVLRLTTEDLSESLEIFLTLNNRGLPLGPSDIVRGEVMGVLSKGLDESAADELQSQLLEEWEEIAAQIDDPEVFLRHYLVATSDEKIQKKKIVSKVTERFKLKDARIAVQKEKAREIWAELGEYAGLYSQIVSPTLSSVSGQRISLLEQLSKSHRIMLLAVLAKKLDDDTTAELVRLTFVLSFKWVMGNQNAQKLEDFFQQRSKDLRNGRSMQEIQTEFKTKVEGLSINAADYFAAEGDSSFITRALLYLIHTHKHPRQVLVELDSKKFHLEHVAPKTATTHWKEKLVGLTAQPSDYKNVVRQGGNLILLDRLLNIDAQQKPFKKKVEDEYGSATFFTHTQDVSSMQDWNTELINQRTQWLGEMFEEIFSASGSKPKVKTFAEWRN